MTSSDPESVPPDLPADALLESPPPSPSGSDAIAVGPARPARTPWGWALSAGVLAGILSWLGGEMTYGRFEVPPTPMSGMIQPPEVVARDARLRLNAHIKEGMATYGLMGAVSGLALGLAGGLVCRSFRAAFVAASAGLVLGSIAGAAAALGAVRVFFQNTDPLSGSLIFPMLVHAGIWAPIGLAGGLAFGIGLGGWRRIVLAALGGVLGAIVGTIVYELAGALAFPLAKSDFPISASAGSRLLAHLVVALFIAAGAAISVQERDPRKP